MKKTKFFSSLLVALFCTSPMMGTNLAIRWDALGVFVPASLLAATTSRFVSAAMYIKGDFGSTNCVLGGLAVGGLALAGLVDTANATPQDACGLIATTITFYALSHLLFDATIFKMKNWFHYYDEREAQLAARK